MPPRKSKSLKASEGIAPTVTVKHEPKPKAAYRVVNRIAYSPELGARICGELVIRDEVDKTRSLRYVCSLEGMPAESTVYEWLSAHEDFAERYGRARETLAEMNANDILTISDTATDANLARLRIDARKWWASKVAPKKYGDKVLVGGDADSPIQVRHDIEFHIIDPA